jgi:hypothetical protein
MEGRGAIPPLLACRAPRERTAWHPHMPRCPHRHPTPIVAASMEGTRAYMHACTHKSGAALRPRARARAECHSPLCSHLSPLLAPVRPNMSRNGPKASASPPYGPLASSRVSGARGPPWVPRTGVSVFFARSRERAPWTRERRPWLFHPCGGLGREKSRFGATQCAFGGGPGLGSRLAKCPDGPNRPPWIPPPAGPIPSWGHQHTSWVLGCYLSASHACLGPILGPCAMTGARAMRGAERAHDPGHLQTLRNST